MFHMSWFTWYGGYEHVPYRAEVVQGAGAGPETRAVVPHAASTVAIRPSAMVRATAAGISVLPLCVVRARAAPGPLQSAARASPSHHCQKPRIVDLSRRTDIRDPPGVTARSESPLCRG